MQQIVSIEDEKKEAEEKSSKAIDNEENHTKQVFVKAGWRNYIYSNRL